MGFIVDGVLLALIVLVVVASAKKGFVKSVMDSLALVISAIATYKLFQPVSKALYDGFVYDMVRTKLVRSIEDSYNTLSFQEKITRMTDTLPESGIRLAKSFGINIDALINTVTESTTDKELVDQFLNKVAYDAVFFIYEIVVFVIMFILLALVVKLLAKFISSILEKIPVLGTANTLLGGVLGIVKAVALVFVVCTVIYFLRGATDDANIINAVDMSKLYAFVTEKNPVINLIG